MIRSILAALLASVVIGGGLTAQPPKGKEPPKKEAPKEKPKDKAPSKGTKAAVKEVTGTFKSKDVAKKSITITVDGKDRTFKIADEAVIVGPRGGATDGLKDDRLDKGYKVTVMPDAKDPETAAEVRLAFRNEREGGEAGKSADKDKK
ncbi:MAG: hypothetical protein K1X57_13485 [Gemmataceae bacterium]|nr:hypothetical protein [Gemmataceae bacterium]